MHWERKCWSLLKCYVVLFTGSWWKLRVRIRNLLSNCRVLSQTPTTQSRNVSSSCLLIVCISCNFFMVEMMPFLISISTVLNSSRHLITLTEMFYRSFSGIQCLEESNYDRLYSISSQKLASFSLSQVFHFISSCRS